MSPFEMFRHITTDIDINDPVVQDEIRRGIREPVGITDIHYHLYALFEASKGNVLEIGVRHGVSTCALLRGVEIHGGHLWSIDTDEKSMHVFEGNPNWTPICADSVKDAFKLLKTIPAKLDLLFVDGDHSYAGVLSDLENYGPRADVIMCHDADEANSPQVLRAIEQYMSLWSTKQKTLHVFPYSHGLAVLS